VGVQPNPAVCLTPDGASGLDHAGRRRGGWKAPGGEGRSLEAGNDGEGVSVDICASKRRRGAADRDRRAGTLGRRIAAVYAAGGTDVHIFDLSAEQRDAAREYVEQHLDETRKTLGLNDATTGRIEAFDDLGDTVRGAWMVIEAIPERVDLKRKVFRQLDELAEADAILASNSSSLPTSLFIDDVEHPERLLNTHYQQPPELNSVELMSSGKTDDSLIDALMEKIPQYGLEPFHVRRESDGFIFNRIWAAIKRESLMVVAEGVATPEEVDRMWTIFNRPGVPPFRLMDRVGLDVVLDIEEHYASVRPGLPEEPRTLLRDYIDQGKLGVKSGRGFYDDYEG
jgi:3-hydroxybutyryl-CoA dehydrogenase